MSYGDYCQISSRSVWFWHLHQQSGFQAIWKESERTENKGPQRHLHVWNRGVGLVLSVWCCGWALTGAGVNSGAPAAQWLCQLCVLQRSWDGRQEKSKVPKYFFALKESKNGTLFKYEYVRIYFFCTYRWNPFLFPKLQTTVQQVNTQKSTCALKAGSFSMFPFQLKFQSEDLCKGNGAAVQQEVWGPQQSSLQVHGV